jgi:hypothetical protein
MGAKERVVRDMTISRPNLGPSTGRTGAAGPVKAVQAGRPMRSPSSIDFLRSFSSERPRVPGARTEAQAA